MAPAIECVISLCDLTGNMVRPWAEAGYECWCVDTQHSIRKDRVEGNIHYVWGDCRSWLPPSGRKVVFGAAFTPCTDVAVSGARDFRKKGPFLLADALEIFAVCEVALRYSGAPYMLENPVGVLSSHIRQPDYWFDPNEYAGYEGGETDTYPKKTGLWTGNGFVMPEKKSMPVTDNRIHRMTPSDERANLRSATPMGFSHAVFESNRNK